MGNESLSELVDKKLLESADLGNEVALHKYATQLSQRAIYLKDSLSDDERADYNQKAIEILTELSNKKHLDSMLTLALLLSNSTDFPNTYDPELAKIIIKGYESISRKDMTSVIDNL